MAEERFNDPLSFDVAADLRRVDGVMTQILKDRGTWTEFLRDPNGVLVRLGLHPPTTPEINDRANRIFYATLTNKELLSLLIRHYEDFRPSNESKFREVSLTAAREGRIQHDIELDLEGFHHVLEHPDVMREALKLSLHDLNDRGLLQNRHRREEIDAYVERLIEAVRHRLPIADHPKLEQWDRNYGIGLKFGGMFAELPFATTIALAVEVAGGVTNLVAVYQVVPFWGPSTDITAASLAVGDENTVRTIAIAGRLLDFAGDLLTYVQNFETKTR
jgi:hypothetical protein